MAEEKDKLTPFYEYKVRKQMTPEEFIKLWQPKLPSSVKQSTVKEILAFEDNTKRKNLDRIWGTYDAAEKSKYESDYNKGELPYIKEGTSLAIPSDKTPLQLSEVSKRGQFVSQNDFEAYWGENYKSIISDESYVPDENVTLKIEGTGINTKTFSVNVRVWIYIKAIDKVIDVSPYVMNVNTTKTKESGTFDITLSPFMFNGSSIKFGDSYQETFNILSNTGHQVRDFLEKKVSYNDIVFIRFERLKKEKKKETDSSNKLELEIATNKLSDGNIWDMIGFVDDCVSSFAPNNKIISISGRDISKLFTDDGCYFLPLEDIQKETFSKWYNLDDPNSIFYKRNVISGEYQFLWIYSFKAIRECIWWIINMMSNIGIVENGVFSSWKDKRTEGYTIEGDSSKKEVNGIWQIFKVFVDKQIENRTIVDTSIGNPNGTMMDYMLRICQQPFVEFYFDTYVDTIDLIVRQPPFNKKAIMDAYKNGNYVTIEADDVYSMALSYDNRSYSWYQVKVANNHVGSSNSVSLAYVPICYFDEYVKVFGNKKLEITDTYISLDCVDGVDKEYRMWTYQAAALNDLIYLIESNAYLPFTRKGTITINGDRRIKVGTFVKCEMTNEFFYVTSVIQSVEFSNGQISRQTTLQVERGMYIPLLEGNFTTVKDRQDNSGQNESGSYSYFDIIDLTEIKQAAKSAEAGKIQSLTSPKVKKDQFDYFVKRKMFS